MSERLHFHFSFSCIGEGNGNPLQYSCLENPRDRGAWWAAVYGVAQSQTRLKRLSSSSSKEIKELNAELQRTARRDKKAFLSDQCKEIEENNRMGSTRDFFKKTGDSKRTLHAKTGTIKYTNHKDLTEAEEIKKRWQEYTELYKKCRW